MPECRADARELAPSSRAGSLPDAPAGGGSLAGHRAARIDPPAAPPDVASAGGSPSRCRSSSRRPRADGDVGRHGLAPHGSGGRGTDFPAVLGETLPRPAANFGDAAFDEAVADLQQTLEAGRGGLDAQTIRILETNLEAIDRAIEQCREALAADPANVYLNTISRKPARQRSSRCSAARRRWSTAE